MTEIWNKTLDFLRGRKRAYQLTFGRENQAAQVVLMDLSQFCRAAESCVMPGDHDRTLLLEGRREVFIRIQQHLNLSSEELMQLYSQRPLQPQQQKGK